MIFKHRDRELLVQVLQQKGTQFLLEKGHCLKKGTNLIGNNCHSINFVDRSLLSDWLSQIGEGQVSCSAGVV